MSSDASSPAPAEDAAGGSRAVAPPWLVATVVVLAVYRALYHLVYLRDDPFASATVSDGRLYEAAAIDVLQHWPLGSEPFYLQGLYVYQLAVPMFWGRLALALLVQLAIVALGWMMLRAALRSMLGERTAAIALALALAIPALAFYENKFLSAALTIDCSIALVAAWAWFERRQGPLPALACGLAGGLAVLARPNLVLALPFVLAALALVAVRGRRRVVALAFVLGTIVPLAPMAWRNAVVTGTATVFPAHGGGTSFYIGNNASARGVWNPAGVFSGDVSHERDELGAAAAASIPEGERVASMGRELYRRAWQDIADDPARWLWLECRKLWLLVGNDDLSQDFDVRGERELIPWAYPIGLPFGVLLGLAIVGALRWWRTTMVLRGRLLVLGGLALATCAANLLFFTSSQHRVPLVIPWVVLAAVGLVELLEHRSDRGWLRAHRIVLVLAGIVAIQAWWPRTRVHAPSSAHYFNLALAYDRIGEPTPALAAADRAVVLAPEHPVILLERASMRRRTGDFTGARTDIARVLALPDTPAWVRIRADNEAALIEIEAAFAAAPPPK